MNQGLKMNLSPLNWKEIAVLVQAYSSAIAESGGLFVERVIAPERPRFPDGYIKSEWAIRLSGRRQVLTFTFSVRPRHPYLMMIEGQGPKLAAGASKSPFDLALSKHLKGLRLLSLEAFDRERSVVFWFEGQKQQKLGLVLALIPAVPEALLLESGDWKIIARSRTIRDAAKVIDRWIPPDGAKAPMELAVRSELVASPAAYSRAIESSLDSEAFEIRLRGAEKSVRDLLKTTIERIRQNETSVREAEREPEWRKFGELLKATLPSAPPADNEGFRLLPDYEKGGEVRVACDPKLSPQAQVEKFFSLARRKHQRAEQARLRLEGFVEARARLQRALERRPELGDWRGLEAFERESGVPVRAGGAAGAPIAKSEKKRSGWLGKTALSKDGWPIWVGRSRDENLELTFKHSRGNDIWMHIRGRPGAHLLIPVPSGKSVPLETLLDAAVLCIYYSGGESWGKTEVDYTFKKYVKRIKDSTEASYTNNKTLIVEPEPGRLKRLLSQTG